jgi:hypothetical protein
VETVRLKQNFRKLNVLDLDKDAYSQLEVHPTHLEHENLQRFTKVRTMGVACKFQPLSRPLKYPSFMRSGALQRMLGPQF